MCMAAYVRDRDPAALQRAGDERHPAEMTGESAVIQVAF